MFGPRCFCIWGSGIAALRLQFVCTLYVGLLYALCRTGASHACSMIFACLCYASIHSVGVLSLRAKCMHKLQFYVQFMCSVRLLCCSFCIHRVCILGQAECKRRVICMKPFCLRIACAFLAVAACSFESGLSTFVLFFCGCVHCACILYAFNTKGMQPGTISVCIVVAFLAHLFACFSLHLGCLFFASFESFPNPCTMRAKSIQRVVLGARGVAFLSFPVLSLALPCLPLNSLACLCFPLPCHL